MVHAPRFTLHASRFTLHASRSTLHGLRMSDLEGARIHITGIVQGVGFRPFVYGLAARLHLAGWVRNTSAGVDIEVDAPPATLERFVRALREEAPPLARIDGLDVVWQAPNGFTAFEIVPSEPIPEAFQPISPDVSICPDCLRELFAPGDRRYLYPFINCTNCGPRFTIITDIPYDRPNTTMAPFTMCPDCAREYDDPLDRRFHAQPVACPVCGPRVWLEMTTGDRRPADDGDNAVFAARRLLSAGRILAVKGLGGFHLACDAANADAVVELRRRKLRVDKPFALMMPDLAAVEQHCLVNAAERLLLESRQRPIVVLRRRSGSTIAREVAPGQDTLGVMLPYTPLHYLLFASVPHPSSFTSPPLVMTSGNLSEEPIAADNAEARQRLAPLADAFLMHDRDIRTRCDDSVVRLFAPTQDRRRKTAGLRPLPYVLRRSRGYAPDPIQLPFEAPPLLAAGPELKNTFCLTRERYAFLSHHVGDMQNYETLRAFEDGVAHFERLFRIKPQAVAYDLHPDYLATRYALTRAGREGLPAIGVQHHHAHIAACMADNGLTGEHPLIGVSFDGTGYGEDGAIWGGEFLIADYAVCRRAAHLEYFPLPGGDAAIKHPARAALALLWRYGLEWEDAFGPSKALCQEERAALRTQLERKLNTPLTSSMGRLFDAAAALAGVRQQVNYEAQAAIEFEALADPDERGAYPFEISEVAEPQSAISIVLSPVPLLSALLSDVRAGLSVDKISARFHNGVAAMVLQVCEGLRRQAGLDEVALSGGVWQNMFLLGRTVELLHRGGFQVYSHRQVPTNDGGLSLGQAAVAIHKIRDPKGLSDP